MPLITLRDIQLSYGQQPLLDHVTLSIDPGERLCLIGRNGAGKSTLMKVIAEEIHADDGQIEKTQGLTVARLEQEVPDDQDHSVHFMVAEGLGEHGALLSEHAELVHHLGDADDKMLARFEQLSSEIEACGAWQLSQRVDTVLSKLKLDGDQAFAGLSGGMKRRVLLARAILHEPQLLLLDEPTQGLDQPGAAAFYRRIEDLRAEIGCAVLMVSHDLHVVMSASDRVICLNGHVCCEGPPESVASAPAYRALFGSGTGGALALYRHEHDHEHDAGCDHDHAHNPEAAE
mgnify:CR=1 FL=1